jgi:NAD(P)-dependent dehydrogenase (short-subunit alcohol dehydrogenase family)
MNANAFCSRSSTIMSARVLVLGAAGRLGHAAARAFRDAGWSVASLVRPGNASRAPADTEIVEIHALDHAAVAKGAPTSFCTRSTHLTRTGHAWRCPSPIPP